MKQEYKDLLADARWIAIGVLVSLVFIIILTFLIVWGSLTLAGQPLW